MTLRRTNINGPLREAIIRIVADYSGEAYRNFTDCISLLDDAELARVLAGLLRCKASAISLKLLYANARKATYVPLMAAVAFRLDTKNPYTNLQLIRYHAGLAERPDLTDEQRAAFRKDIVI